MKILSIFAVLSGAVSLLSLLALHFTSPEFNPRWRMVSEYALGKYKWIITLFFYMWGASSLFLSFGMLEIISSFWAYFGVALLAISGIGAICGGLFDVNHPKHGMAFALGVPTLPIAAVILTYHLLNAEIITQSYTLIWAHSTWISLILMSLAMMLMFSGFKKAGIKWDKDSPPIKKVPEGVIAIVGYTNRLLVFCYIFWVIYIAYLLYIS